MNDIKLTDGGLGTELRYRGVEVPSHVNSIWSAQAIIDAPNEIEKIHYDYIQAGADHITINNYALTQPILKRAKIQERLKDLTLQSIDIARNAIDRSNKKVVLMGSLPPLETSYRPDLILPEEEMYNKNKEIADILNNNVDIILCETMSSGLEAKCALKAALETDCSVWLSWTLQGNRKNYLPSGETIQEAFELLNNNLPDALLVNCAGANLVGQAIKKLSKLTDIPIGGYAYSENIQSFSENRERVDNADEMHRESSVPLNEKEYAMEVSKWIDSGASIVGGCCRTRPSHIKEIRKLIDSSFS